MLLGMLPLPEERLIMGTVQPDAPRSMCYRCHRPRSTCICDLVARVPNRTGIWIVQHPRERFHPFGTARIARLGLTRIQLSVCFRPDPEPPPGFPTDAALLYPADDADDLTDIEPHRRPETLVVIDGTWPHARGIYRNNPWLQGLPRYRIRPRTPGRYRIRREPARHCLSTIESIVQALECLEPDTHGLRGLLDAFDSMIDEQIRLGEQHGVGRFQRHRQRRGGGSLPRLLGAEPERLVIVYGESCATPPGSPGVGRRGRRLLVQWTAVRPSTKATFDRVLRSTGDVPTAAHLAHMGLDVRAARNGVSVEELKRDWQSFLREGDVVLAWNQSTVDLLRSGLGDSSPALLLKSAYCNVHPGAPGTIADVLQREGLEPLVVAVDGRARHRLGNALALLRRLQSMSQQPRGCSRATRRCS